MLNDLSTKLKELEDTRGKANERLRVSRDLVSGLRDRREKVSSEKADLEDRINIVNKAFEAKKDALQKLKWSYVINSEEALDQQVLLLLLFCFKKNILISKYIFQGTSHFSGCFENSLSQ